MEMSEASMEDDEEEDSDGTLIDDMMPLQTDIHINPRNRIY